MGIKRLKALPLPRSEPRRYVGKNGYVLLRWKIAPYEYVEAYEHRVIMGFPDGHVHHRNGNRSDNRRSNLRVLSPHEHNRHHNPRGINDREVARLYKQGMSTPDIAALLCHDASAVWRALRRHGVRTRTLSESRRLPLNEKRVLRLFDQGLRPQAIADRLGCSRAPIDRIVRAHRRPHAAGRPPTLDMRKPR